MDENKNIHGCVACLFVRPWTMTSLNSIGIFHDSNFLFETSKQKNYGCVPIRHSHVTKTLSFKEKKISNLYAINQINQRGSVFRKTINKQNMNSDNNSQSSGFYGLKRHLLSIKFGYLMIYCVIWFLHTHRHTIPLPVFYADC